MNSAFEEAFKKAGVKVEKSEVKAVSDNVENKYASAPYNFIEFPDKVVYRYNNVEELPKHNIFDSKLNTGYIEYSFKNETPLYIGSGTDRESFFKVNGNPVIPGSTIRGLVRSNAEILSFSYPKFVEDRRFMYRALAGHKSLRNEYSKQMKGERLENKVKVGYLFKGNDGKYKIKPSKKIIYNLNGEKKEKEFFTIDEFRLKKLLKNNSKRIKWMYKYQPEKVLELEININIINKEIKKLYKDNKIELELIKEIGNKYANLTRGKIEKKNFFNFLSKKIINEDIFKKFEKKYSLWDEKQKEWKTFIKNKDNVNKGNLCYEMKEKATIEEKNGGINNIELNSKENFGEKVIFYNSNYIQGKRKHYIIPQEFEEKEIEIDDNIIYEYKKELESKSFLMLKGCDSEKKKIKEFYEIKDTGKIFFYKEVNGKIIAVSRTPYLRLAFDRSIKEILDSQIKDKNEEGIDYVEGIFGFVNKKCNNKNLSYKSRVSFEDITCSKENYKGEKDLILSNPKATSFQLYLKQEINNPKNLNTYNNEKSELRGQKFYWMKDIKGNNDESSNGDIKTKINPIKKDIRFKGKIYFENLHNDELGLLLLALNYDREMRDSVGMGKPYGYGRIAFDNIEIYKENKKDSFLSFDHKALENLKEEDLKNEYIKFIEKEKIKGKYEDNISIINYQCSKYIQNEVESNYMDIQTKSEPNFRKRNILPTVKKIKSLRRKNGR